MDLTKYSISRSSGSQASQEEPKLSLEQQELPLRGCKVRGRRGLCLARNQSPMRQDVEFQMLSTSKSHRLCIVPSVALVAGRAAC